MQTRDEVEGLHPTPRVFISGYANTENVFYCLISTLIWQTRDNNDVWRVISCLYAPPRPTQSRSCSCRITHVRHVSGHSGIPRFATSQAKPVKIIGQTNFNKVNPPHYACHRKERNLYSSFISTHFAIQFDGMKQSQEPMAFTMQVRTSKKCLRGPRLLIMSLILKIYLYIKICCWSWLLGKWTVWVPECLNLHVPQFLVLGRIWISLEDSAYYLKISKPVCHYGGRPRFPAVPISTLKLLTVAASITLEQIKKSFKATTCSC